VCCISPSLHPASVPVTHPHCLLLALCASLHHDTRLEGWKSTKNINLKQKFWRISVTSNCVIIFLRKKGRHALDFKRNGRSPASYYYRLVTRCQSSTNLLILPSERKFQEPCASQMLFLPGFSFHKRDCSQILHVWNKIRYLTILYQSIGSFEDEDISVNMVKY